MQVSTIGLDLAKNVFQAHGVSAEGKVVLKKQLRRGQVLSTFAKLPPRLVGMEACAGAHYWARELRKLGHDVRLMPARGREGLCEARQDRCGGRGGDLRGGEPSFDALCGAQDARAARATDAAPGARSAAAAAHADHQR